MLKVHIKITAFILITSFASGSLYYHHDTMAQGFSQNIGTRFVGNMSIDKRTGIPITIFRPKTRKYSGSPSQIAHQYLQENKNLLGMIDDLSDLALVNVKESLAGKHVSYRQVYNGVPVMGSGIVVSINKDNYVYIVVNHHKPDISVNTIPAISEDMALQLAKDAVGSESYSSVIPQKIELKIYQDSTYVYHLVWRVVLYPDDLGGEWLVLIDAQSGDILINRDVAFYYDNYVDGSGYVFNPDPGSYFRCDTLPDNNNEDYFEDMFGDSASFVYKEVVLRDLIPDSSDSIRMRGEYAWAFGGANPDGEIYEPAIEADKDSFFLQKKPSWF